MMKENVNNKNKIQFNIVLCFILVLILGIGVYTKKLIDKTEEQNQAHIKEVTVQTANNISSKFDIYFRELRYIKKNIIENDVLSDETKKNLLTYKMDEQVFKDIIIVDNQGYGIKSNEKNVYIGDTEYFKTIRKSTIATVSEPQNNQIFGNNSVIYSIPIKKNSENIGFILGVSDSQILVDKLSTGVYGDKGESYIINKNKKVIFSKYKNQINRNIDDVLHDINSLNDMLNKNQDIYGDTQEGTVIKSSDKENIYIGFSKIPNTNNWYVINSVPENNILQNSKSITQILVVIIISIVITFIIIGIYFFKMQQRLKQTAFKDKITNINNYEKFLLDSSNFIKSKRRNKGLLLFCFDIDKFKIINDIHGYETGEMVLKSIGKNLKDHFSSKSVYGRITGDIFVLLVESEQTKKEIKNIAEIICKDIVSIEDPENLEYSFNIQTCIGVYIVQEDDVDINKIVANADVARIKSKEEPYNQYVIFDENMRSELKLTAKLEKDLYSSIENKELEIYYQPKFNINSDSIVGAEALIRWNHSSMGLISPMKFIPIAEKNRFINKIGSWVFEEVCRNIRECIDEGIDVVPISVNISRVELYQPTLIENFKISIEKYKIDPRLIEIEITETTALNNIQFINSKLSEIKGLGMKVAMDDFGTGNSNLSNLKDIAIDVLKLDRSLLIDIENNDKTEVMVKSIVSLSNNLNMSTVCEGVENISQVDIIRNTGCEVIQGFVFSKPIKNDEYKGLLKSRKALI